MRLFIAEKPSVAKAIAAELGVTGENYRQVDQVCHSNCECWGP